MSDTVRKENANCLTSDLMSGTLIRQDPGNLVGTRLPVLGPTSPSEGETIYGISAERSEARGSA